MLSRVSGVLVTGAFLQFSSQRLTETNAPGDPGAVAPPRELGRPGVDRGHESEIASNNPLTFWPLARHIFRMNLSGCDNRAPGDLETRR
jgi:hypothetical protein